MISSGNIVDAVTIFELFFMSYLALIPLERNLKQYKETKVWNWTRFLLVLFLLGYVVQIVISILLYDIKIIPDLESLPDIDRITITVLGFGLNVCVGLALISYMYHKDSIILMPSFYYFGAIIMYFTLGNPYFILILCFGGLIIVLLGLFITGLRLKDNNSFGIALLLSVIAFTPMLRNDYIFIASQLIGMIIGFFIVTDRFNIFRRMK